jgi:asparagine synthetase B (glutamine-hydrolysing)
MADQSDTGPVLAISLTHPLAMRREGRLGTWFATSLAAEELERLAAADAPDAAADETIRRCRGASLVFVANATEAVGPVTAWKGLISSNEIYFARLPSKGWIVTDHFRNALAALPAGERSMSDAALLAHYVSASVFDRLTYSRGVDRLANGERLDLDVRSNSVGLRIFSRHDSTATDDPMAVHLNRLDGAFEDAVGSLRSVEGLGVGFSGGVDSTLLLSYLGDAGTPVTVVPGTPEFDIETAYAMEASDLLGRTPEILRLDEAEYLPRLVDSIETAGMPTWSYVTPVIDGLYEHSSSVFLMGEGADSVFGSGRGIRRVASTLSSQTGRSGLRAMGRIPGGVGRRARQVGSYAELFAEPAGSPDGYAGRALEYYGDNSPAFHMFGSAAISRYFADLLLRVADRVDLETAEDDRFFRHIELTQWRYVFSDLAFAGNHAAQAVGKYQIQPFSEWRVISEHLKVPARRRYYKGLAGKWMLKELLERRVPGYKVNKRKLATALPFARYYDNGPLTGFWDRYEVPTAIPPELHEALIATPTEMTWKAMTHAIWEDRVVRNPDLTPHPAAVSASWSLVD